MFYFSKNLEPKLGEGKRDGHSKYDVVFIDHYQKFDFGEWDRPDVKKFQFYTT